jgi:choline dehydrogenase-like flavoprotein
MNASQDDRQVVVIGTGPAGAIAARILAERNVPVTLLEAGSRRSALGLTLRVAGVTLVSLRRRLQQRTDDVIRTGDPNAELWEDIAAGGLTNHWAGAVPRFSRDDFRDAERAGEEYRWPIRYEDLAVRPCRAPPAGFRSLGRCPAAAGEPGAARLEAGGGLVVGGFGGPRRRAQRAASSL